MTHESGSASEDERGHRLERALGFRPKFPLVQGVLAGCAGPTLLAAVARAGAVPTVAVHCLRPAQARRLFRKIRSHTRRPMIVAFTGDWERDEVLDTAIAAGFTAFQTFWWNTERLAPRIHAAGGRVLMQAGTLEQIHDGHRLGVDGLLLQGTEAGGPVRSHVPLRQLISDAREIVGPDFPIVAGGGLADASDIVETLRAGADAVMLGTRFLLTRESRASARDKARLARADHRRLLLDTRLVGPWPCAARRRLVPIPDVDRPSLFAGLGVDRITDVVSVSRAVSRLVGPLSPSARARKPPL